MGLLKGQIEQTDKGLMPMDVNKSGDLQTFPGGAPVTNESFPEVPKAGIGDYKNNARKTATTSKIQGGGISRRA